MKLAILMLCHKSPDQIVKFLDQVNNENITTFIHIDKKSNIDEKKFNNEFVKVLPKSKRVDVQWAQYSQVEATLNLIEYAKNYDDYDFYFLISGQDFPIKSNSFILDYLKKNEKFNFINLVNSKNYADRIYNNYDKRCDIFYNNVILRRYGISRIIRRIWVEISGGYNKTFKLFKRKN